MRIVSVAVDGGREAAIRLDGGFDVVRIAGTPAEPWEVAEHHLEGGVITPWRRIDGSPATWEPPARPAVVLAAEDAFATQSSSRKVGLAAQRPAALEAVRRPDPAEDVWLIPRDPLSLGAGTSIRCPLGCTRLDAGITLGAVVGRRSVVAWCAALDVVRRDVPPEQAILARSYPTHTPISIDLVTLSELGSLDDVELELDVDGAARQRAVIADLAVPPAVLLRSIGARYRLPPGSLVLLGAPPGTAHDRRAGWLQPGQQVVGRAGPLEIRRVVVLDERSPTPPRDER